jgi:hypothetical protein
VSKLRDRKESRYHLGSTSPANNILNGHKMTHQISKNSDHWICVLTIKSLNEDFFGESKYQGMFTVKSEGQLFVVLRSDGKRMVRLPNRVGEGFRVGPSTLVWCLRMYFGLRSEFRQGYSIFILMMSEVRDIGNPKSVFERAGWPNSERMICQ